MKRWRFRPFLRPFSKRGLEPTACLSIIFNRKKNRTMLIDRIDFGCQEQTSVEGSSRNTTLLGSLMSTGNFTCAPTGFGQRAASSPNQRAILQSTRTIASLQEQIVHSGFTVEVWVSPKRVPDGATTISSILTIGQSASPEEEDLESCRGYDFRIAQRANTFFVSFVDDDPARTCRLLTIHDYVIEQDDALTQIVVTVDTGGTSVYINGRALVLNAPSRSTGTWNRYKSNYRLQFFSDYILPNISDRSAVFNGSIHQAAFYNEALTDVFESFEAGLSSIQESIVRSLALVATPLHNVIVEQGYNQKTAPGIDNVDNGALWIGGNYLTQEGMPYTFVVEIMTLPRYGRLMAKRSEDQEEEQVVQEGMMVPLPSQQRRTLLTYQVRSENYFNTPPISASQVDLHLDAETFDYRLVVLDGDHVVGVSSTVAQSIHVVHVNHRPQLATPISAILPQDSDGYAYVPQVEVLDDVDLNVDRIRVDVVAGSGTLTLNPNYLHLADFESCAGRSFSWQCYGTGVEDRSMTFLAEPTDVSYILSDLKYKWFNDVQSDEITITIFDGVGGNCLDESEQNRYRDEYGNSFSTISRECFEISGRIQVPAASRSSSPSADSSGSGNILPTPGGLNGSLDQVDKLDFSFVWFFLMVMVFSCLGCCCIRETFCYRPKKKKSKDNSGGE